jgi:hypothetical protein
MENFSNVFIVTFEQFQVRRKVSSGMLSRVDVVKTVVSEERRFLTRATRRNIPEVAILHSHRSENLKYYTVYLCSLLLST